MWKDSSNVATADTKINTTPLIQKREIAESLNEFGICLKPAGFYWLVGEITKTQGWILHLSAIKTQLPELLNEVVPSLLDAGVPFKVVKDWDIAEGLLNGSLGNTKLGKLISIYPESDVQACQIADTMINITKQFEGPEILTDFHLGSVVYTRFGSFNPMIVVGRNGAKMAQIYNSKGKLIPDAYDIPFDSPAGIPWPFGTIRRNQKPKRLILIHSKYYPKQIIKDDPKGRVIEALYFQSFFKIKSCIIKEGRKSMISDDCGRDVNDRIKWQFELTNRLSQDIPMPCIYDCFDEDGNSFLVIERINGIPLQTWIMALYNGNSWSDLPGQIKILILDRLMEVVSIVRRLHDLGYVHRDLTPENFLIDLKDGGIYCIDMELAWSELLNYPDPPFGIGTPGYISPEQQKLLRPTRKEDIFALGSFMLTFFTGLLPIKWSSRSHEHMRRTLPELLGSCDLSDLICSCRDPRPEGRPDVNYVLTSLQKFGEQICQTPILERPAERSALLSSAISAVIQAGINGLANSSLLSPRNRWFSKPQIKPDEGMGINVELDVVPGWHTGVSGPMWLISRAKIAGFDTSICDQIYFDNLGFIYEYINEQGNQSTSLFHGTAGCAYAIAEGIKSGIITSDATTEHYLLQCFPIFDKNINHECRTSGEGIAILRCSPWLEKEKLGKLLAEITGRFLSLEVRSGNKAELTDAILFLLQAERTFSMESALKNYLQTLIGLNFDKNFIFKPGKRVVAQSHSMVGILFCLTKAYEIFKDDKYRRVVELNLSRLHKRFVSSNFTLDTGLASLGLLYVEASIVFESEEWKERADWIAELFVLTFQRTTPNCGYWVPSNSDITTADLYTGISGILQFLIRYYRPLRSSHPLFPVNI